MPPHAMLLPGTLDVLVLKAVSLGPLHGYGVLLRIEQITKGALLVEQGALYPALYRLEQQGLLSTAWGVSDNNRRAKFYRLTPAGGIAGCRSSGRTGSVWPMRWRRRSTRGRGRCDDMWTRLRLRFCRAGRAHAIRARAGRRAGVPRPGARRGVGAAGAVAGGGAPAGALIELGSAERIKEEVRDVRLGRWLEVLRQDLRYGFRVLRAHPGITAVGVVSLAFGMAVCIYSFSRVHADYLAPLPGARDPDSLVAVDARLSFPAFERIRELDDVVDAATAYLGPVPFSVAVDGEQGAERVFGHLVSPEYFEALGVAPAAGRLLSPGTLRAGSESAVVVSERFWRRRLDADPRAVGSMLQVNGRSVTLAGIAAGGFRGVFPASPAEIFVPVTVGAALAPELEGDILSDEGAERFQVVARLASGGVDADSRSGARHGGAGAGRARNPTSANAAARAGGCGCFQRAASFESNRRSCGSRWASSGCSSGSC